MKNMILIGVLAALATGAAIGAQATLGSRIGAVIGPVRTGMLMNVVGGGLALLLFLASLLIPGQEGGAVSRNVFQMLLAAGLLGVFIVMGVSFSLQSTGVTAGLATILLGQMALGIFVDASGWGGVEPIPLNLPRLVGLAVMALAIYLLLPRS
jgi:uncharacterized membrane protein YdcZ (DUF606 family)